MPFQNIISRRSFIAGTFATIAGLGLSACASGGSTSGSGGSTSAASSSSTGGSSSGSVVSNSGSHNVLVAYFSATGNTRRVGQRIARDLGADTFEITPAQPYSNDDLNFNNSSSRVVREYQDQSQRDIPLSVTTPDNWADYDVVFVGYPIWWTNYAWPIAHFASDNDFTGKTVYPFCTSMSSGLGNSGRDLANLAGTGDWQDGQRFGENASNDDVDNWVSSLGL
ncbi:flavodoxin [Parafannyhessea umbonata]|uniref:Flavodoxin n=1 Tax=Parafannyhessea umbonata TaxID=604330 RepID=A0A1G6MLS5_9ACTN|nr:flavodoxin [Parafannyhessea umbonata]SDC56568.1 Flavodoxin [Parafannyhessea umbonata]